MTWMQNIIFLLMEIEKKKRVCNMPYCKHFLSNCILVFISAYRKDKTIKTNFSHSSQFCVPHYKGQTFQLLLWKCFPLQLCHHKIMNIHTQNSLTFTYFFHSNLCLLICMTVLPTARQSKRLQSYLQSLLNHLNKVSFKSEM